MKTRVLAFALTLAVSTSGVQAATDLTLSVRSDGLGSITAYNGTVVSYEVRGELSNTANRGLAGFSFDLVYSGGNLTQVQASPDLGSFVIPSGFTNASGFGGNTEVEGREGDLVQVGGAQNTLRNTKDKNLFPLGSVVPELGWTEVVLAEGSLLTPEDAGEYTLSIPVELVKANVIKAGETGFPFWATEAIANATTNALTITVIELLPPGLPGAPHDAPKNRYISIDPTTNEDDAAAIRVKLSSMKRCNGDDRRACIVDADCPGVCSLNHDLQCEDDGICGAAGPCVPSGPCVDHPDVGTVTNWVDAPFGRECVPLEDCSGQWFAHLVDSAVYRIWTEGVVHIADCQIIPVAAYEVQATFDGDIFSDPLTLATIAKPQVQYGDCVGLVVGGQFEPPNGFVNVTDVQAYLVANEGGPTAPHTTWVDLHGGAGTICDEPDTACIVPQQILGISDLQWIKFGFLGQTYVETPGQENPGDCPPRTGAGGDESQSGGGGAPLPPPPPGGGDPIPFALLPSSSSIEAGQTVDVEVLIDSVDDLMAYEVSLEVTGGTTGQLDLTDITFDAQHPDYVFASAPAVTKGGVVSRRQAFGVANAGVPVTGPAYLATFGYQASIDASGTFQISVRTGLDILILNDSDGQPYDTDPGFGTSIEVTIECLTDPDCDDDDDCTIDTCVNYECVNDNAPQGTQCDDGLFCTTIDTCDGAGTCTGRASPCPKFYFCDELNDECRFGPPGQQ